LRISRQHKCVLTRTKVTTVILRQIEEHNLDLGKQLIPRVPGYNVNEGIMDVSGPVTCECRTEAIPPEPPGTTSAFPSRDICVLARSGATVPYIAMASPEKVKLAEASVVCEKLLDFSEVLDLTDQYSH